VLKEKQEKEVKDEKKKRKPGAKIKVFSQGFY